MRIVLASASPRRADLLRAAGFAFDVVPANVDERTRDGEAPADYVRRLASEKSLAVLASARADPGNGARHLDEMVVIGADTAVVVDGLVLGKPRDDAEAGDMLRRLAGRWHEVLTGVSLRSQQRESAGLETTRVQFAPLSEAQIAWYVSSGEGRDKAGAYAIQGLASRFVPRLDGSYTNVVGLPVVLVRELLTAFETRYPDR